MGPFSLELPSRPPGPKVPGGLFPPLCAVGFGSPSQLFCLRGHLPESGDFQSLQMEALGPLLATRGLRRGLRKVQGGPTAERDPAPGPEMPQANPEGRRPVLLCIPPKAEPEARLGSGLFCKGHLRSREE